MKSDEMTDIFCDNIRFLRKTRGFSFQKMSEIMGISVYKLKKIESGVLPPSLDVGVLFGLQIAFEIKCADFLSERFSEKVSYYTGEKITNRASGRED